MPKYGHTWRVPISLLLTFFVFPSHQWDFSMWNRLVTSQTDTSHLQVCAHYKCLGSWHSPDYDINFRMFTGHAMVCMHSQSLPQYILITLFQKSEGLPPQQGSTYRHIIWAQHSSQWKTRSALLMQHQTVLNDRKPPPPPPPPQKKKAKNKLISLYIHVCALYLQLSIDTENSGVLNISFSI